jgi:hypothetical protein
MTDNPPVAAAGPLPPLLLNSSITDVKFGYVFDAAGDKVELARFKCSQIRGFTMRRLPMPELRAFCISMGIIVPNDATQSSLLEPLATKKMDLLAQAATRPAINHYQDKDSSHKENVSNASNQSNQSSILSTGELVRHATLKDVAILTWSQRRWHMLPCSCEIFPN